MSTPSRDTIRDFVAEELSGWIDYESIEDIVDSMEVFVRRCLTEQAQFSILGNEKQDEKTPRP